MDDVARARVCVCFFRDTNTRARIKLAYIRQAEGRGRSPVQRVQANGTKVDCDYTCVYVCSRARAVTRETHVSACLVNSEKKYLIGGIFNICGS